MTTQPSDWAVAKAWQEYCSVHANDMQVIGDAQFKVTKRARELDASGGGKPRAAVVDRNCTCHPETCCCGPYSLTIDGEVVVSGWERPMRQIADAINATPRAAEAGDWLPIEAAPRDGRYILVANSHGAWVAKWHPVYQSGYRPSNPWASMMLNHDHIEKPGRFDHPTHWCELKAPRAAMGAVGAGGGE